MGIQEKLDYLQQTKQEIRDAIISKGVYVGSEDTFRSYVDKIGEISGGGSGDTNPNYVPRYYTVDPLSGIASLGNYETFNFTLPSDIVQLSDYFLIRMFYNTNIQNVDLSNIVAITGISCMDAAFRDSGLVSIDLSSLNQITGNYCFKYAFAGTPIQNLSFPNVKTISGNMDCMGYMCDGCTNLQTVDFPKLEKLTLGSNYSMSDNYVFNYAFRNCVSLQQISFPKLAVLSYKAFQNTFQGCTSLKNIYFNALTSLGIGTSNTNHFTNMLNGVTGCTVHFPASLQTTMETWDDVKNGFGGTDTIVLFDL